MKILTEGVILIRPDGDILVVAFKIDGTEEELKLEVARRIMLAAQKCVVPFDWKDSISRP